MVLLQALDGSGNLIPVLLDSSGKIISVLQGIDGATLRTLKVDSAGQMYTLIKGSGGESIAVDGSGNLSAAMKGLDGATLRTVAVDGSGNIIGVLKGDYLGSLKTLATDDAGRLLAKIYDPQNVFGTNLAIGLSEHGNRVQAPLMVDKKGEVIWYDNFESPILKWTVQTQGAASTAMLSTARAHEGERSCKLSTGTTNADYARIRHGIFDPSVKKCGMQCFFSPSTGFVANGYIDLDLSQRSSDTIKTGILRIYGNGDIQIYKDPPGWQAISSLGNLSDIYQTWYVMKLVIDFTTGKYVRCIIGTQEFDLSAYTMTSSVLAGANWMDSYIEVVTNAAASAEAYVDGVVVAANEV